MWTINSELPEGAFHILLVLQEPSAPIQFIPRRCQIFKIFLHSRDDYSEQNMFGEWLRVKVLHQQKADCVGDGPRKALKIPSAVYPETSSTSRFSPANATEPVPVCTESAPDSPVRKGPFPVPPPRRGRLKKAPDLLEGYHMFEYCIQRMDQRLLAVVKYPLLLIVLFVILRSLEVLPSSLTIVFILIMTLMGYLNAWSTVSEGNCDFFLLKFLTLSSWSLKLMHCFWFFRNVNSHQLLWNTNNTEEYSREAKIRQVCAN